MATDRTGECMFSIQSVGVDDGSNKMYFKLEYMFYEVNNVDDAQVRLHNAGNYRLGVRSCSSVSQKKKVQLCNYLKVRK